MVSLFDFSCTKNTLLFVGEPKLYIVQLRREFCSQIRSTNPVKRANPSYFIMLYGEIAGCFHISQLLDNLINDKYLYHTAMFLKHYTYIHITMDE